jgi:hypothetical protein
MGKRWTDEDVHNLKRLAQRHSLPKIAEMMERPVGGVVFKAQQLKLSLRTRQQEADNQLTARANNPQPSSTMPATVTARKP